MFNVLYIKKEAIFTIESGYRFDCFTESALSNGSWTRYSVNTLEDKEDLSI